MLKTFGFLVLLCLSSALVNGLNVRVDVLADAYLDDYHRNTNYGSVADGLLFTDAMTGVRYDIVVMFNISQVPSSIYSAVVKYKQQWAIAPENAGFPNTFTIDEIATNWTESTVTWNNKPVTLGNIGSGIDDGDIEWVLAPVTSALTNAKQQNRQLFAIRISIGDNVVPVYMRETGYYYDQPHLIYTV